MKKYNTRRWVERSDKSVDGDERIRSALADNDGAGIWMK